MCSLHASSPDVLSGDHPPLRHHQCVLSSVCSHQRSLGQSGVLFHTGDWLEGFGDVYSVSRKSGDPAWKTSRIQETLGGQHHCQGHATGQFA